MPQIHNGINEGAHLLNGRAEDLPDSKHGLRHRAEYFTKPTHAGDEIWIGINIADGFAIADKLLEQRALEILCGNFAKNFDLIFEVFGLAREFVIEYDTKSLGLLAHF